MADPYVNFAPAEVGPCTATWFVGPDSGAEDGNQGPTFGPATPSQEVGAWDFLVDGPLKDVLTENHGTRDAALLAWAKAGGQIDFVVMSARQSIVIQSSVFSPWTSDVLDLDPSAYGFAWFLGLDVSGLDPADYPLRWVVKFSVPHSIIR